MVRPKQSGRDQATVRGSFPKHHYTSEILALRFIQRFIEDYPRKKAQKIKGKGHVE